MYLEEKEKRILVMTLWEVIRKENRHITSILRTANLYGAFSGKTCFNMGYAEQIRLSIETLDPQNPKSLVFQPQYKGE